MRLHFGGADAYMLLFVLDRDTPLIIPTERCLLVPHPVFTFNKDHDDE